ncbi:hypothetical protein [Streptosporangium amethystogenes]|uniref:hypothetical protein n=1 Tax=Streptosporangium amethystogenes TaxID=2002 RepID=UPI00146FDAD7|nr:hypothetical protein [Streptosporangium amethystogenes]
MAGWLFADLLLGLTIIMLGAQAPPLSPTDPVADTARFQPAPFQSPPDSTRPPAEEPPTEEPPTEESPTEKSPTEKPPEKGTSEREGRPEKPPEKKSPEKPGPSPSPCTGLVGGVRAKPVTLSFRVTPGAGDGVLAAQVRQELRRHRDRLAGRRVGMLLTFGSDGGARGGVHLASRVNAAILAAYPGTFGTAVTRDFHDLSAPSGSISAEIYFVTHGCSPAPTTPGSPD